MGFGVPGLIDGDRSMHFTSQDTPRWALEQPSVDLMPPYLALGCRTQEFQSGLLPQVQIPLHENGTFLSLATRQR